MKKALILLLAMLLFGANLALAGEQILIHCTNPACHYTRNLALGGAKLSPAITCYCYRCRDFVRLKLKDWSQYRDQQYLCPQCGQSATPIYSREEISQYPCPRCGKLTLKTKNLLLFD